jgi:hypothetical protein
MPLNRVFHFRAVNGRIGSIHGIKPNDDLPRLFTDVHGRRWACDHLFGATATPNATARSLRGVPENQDVALAIAFDRTGHVSPPHDGKPPPRTGAEFALPTCHWAR